MTICRFSNVTVKPARNAAILTAAGVNAVLNIYTGDPPNDASVPATGMLLAVFACSEVFGTLSAGVSGGATPALTSNPMAQTNGMATGKPGYARLQTATGVGVVDLDCGPAGSTASVIMVPDIITLDAPALVTTITIAEP